jgi:hypothetical protein
MARAALSIAAANAGALCRPELLEQLSPDAQQREYHRAVFLPDRALPGQQREGVPHRAAPNLAVPLADPLY